MPHAGFSFGATYYLVTQPMSSVIQSRFWCLRSVLGNGNTLGSSTLSLLRYSRRKISQRLLALESRILNDPRIRIGREVPRPLHKRGALMLAGRDRKTANRRDHARVAQRRRGGNDAVSDVVIDGRVLLLLDVQHGAVLEGPLHDVSLVRRALGVVALGQLAPEVREVRQLDQVPDGGERGVDDGGFGHGRGGRDAGGHGLVWLTGF